MKRFAFILLFFMALAITKAETISSVEYHGSWVYLYNDAGKRYKTLSASEVGIVKGFSSQFFVSVKGSWVYLWDADGKRYKTLSVSEVGEVTGVAGSTFTSCKGSWIYTWNSQGKKINTRSR